MPKPGDVYAIPFPEGGRTDGDVAAPLVCLLRCEEGEDTYRGVILLDADPGGARPSEQQILVPSAHTLSKNVYVMFTDMSVAIDPASLAKRRVDFICGDTLVAALMLCQHRLTGGFDHRVVIDRLDTDDPESDVEGEAFDAAWGHHTMKKCEISDGVTSVEFFTGRGAPCYNNRFEGNALDHASYVASLALSTIGEWEGAPPTEPAGIKR